MNSNLIKSVSTSARAKQPAAVQRNIRERLSKADKVGDLQLLRESRFRIVLRAM